MAKKIKDQSFAEFVRNKRKEFFLKPYDLAYKSFLDLSLDKKDSNYFLKHASQIIEEIRKENWHYFLVAEEEFSKSVFKSINEKEDYKGLNNLQAVNKFIDHHLDDFYKLSLSNTQSRRCRAGSEFESIVELLFIGANIMLDSQGFLSSGIFKDHSLGKAVDLVSPGVLEYSITKRTCSLISCKTSCRERWSEVIEEKERTGASEIYLATLDEKVSKRTLTILNDKNVILVVTKKIKEKCYSSNNNVITFEELLSIVTSKNRYWTYDMYAPEKLMERVELIDKQINRHIEEKHQYVKEFYDRVKCDLLCLPDE